jgi:hypothetical protein
MIYWSPPWLHGQVHRKATRDCAKAAAIVLVDRKRRTTATVTLLHMRGSRSQAMQAIAEKAWRVQFRSLGWGKAEPRKVL